MAKTILNVGLCSSREEDRTTMILDSVLSWSSVSRSDELPACLKDTNLGETGYERRKEEKAVVDYHRNYFLKRPT